MKQQAKELRDQGLSYKEISDQLGIPRSTIWNWFNRVKGAFAASSSAPVSNIHVVDQTVKQQDQSLHDLIMQLAPINYAAPTRSKVRQSPTQTSLVIGDTHFGSESQAVIDIFLQTVEEIRPKSIILNGDTLDMFAISRYPKDVRYTVTLQKERESYHRFLKQLHDITEAYDTVIYETNANHSGDGLEGRWWRYLSDRIGELACLPEIKEKLSYGNVFLPDESWSRVKLVEFVEIVPGFVAMHGDVVRKHGGYSARGLLEKWYTSIIANHTHRIGMSSQRIPSIGTQQERIIRVYENGCACDLNPLYASAANWQNAFSVVNHADGNIAVETVVVEGNRAAVGMLGKVIKA